MKAGANPDHVGEGLAEDGTALVQLSPRAATTVVAMGEVEGVWWRHRECCRDVCGMMPVVSL